MTAHYRAVVLGATGAVGSALTAELLGSPVCDEVTILTRRQFQRFAAFRGSSKLIQCVIDLGDIEEETATWAAGYDAAFCTMGVGQPRKSSAEEFWRVDVEYASAFARGAKKGGVHHISLLSSVGADPEAASRYLRVKGSAEKGVVMAGIERTSIFRPSLLVTPEIRYGLQDRLTQMFFPLLVPVLPRRFHPIRVESLGRAMRLNAECAGRAGVEILHYRDFRRLLDAAPRRS